MRICSNCGKEHDNNHTYCLSCRKIYDANRYQEKKDLIREQQKKRKREITKWLKGIKEDASCIKCGNSHPAVIDYHHRDPSKKEVRISAIMGKGWSRERILKEIKKCDTLCANCHRILHWEEQ